MSSQENGGMTKGFLADITKNSNSDTLTHVEQSGEKIYRGPCGVLLKGKVARMHRFMDRIESKSRINEVFKPISTEIEAFDQQEIQPDETRNGANRILLEKQSSLSREIDGNTTTRGSMTI